jgi:hypothetical protein
VDAALFLLGTSHPIQCGITGVHKAASFEAELRRICTEVGIRRIAEEMNDAGLKRHGVSSTVGQRISEEDGLLHHNVDLSLEDRAAVSLDDGVMLEIAFGGYGVDPERFRDALEVLWSDVRERAWIGRLLSRKEWPVLFICGSDHSESLEGLWTSLGLPATIVHRDYEP